MGTKGDGLRKIQGKVLKGGWMSEGELVPRVIRVVGRGVKWLMWGSLGKVRVEEMGKKGDVRGRARGRLRKM